jgi:hypothetical protein
VITMDGLNYDKPPVPRAAPAAAVGVGLGGGVGAVLLDVLHSGGSSVAIALIAGSTIIIAIGILTVGFASQWIGSTAGSIRSTANWFYGSPILSSLPHYWDQQSIRATLRLEGEPVPFEVLAVRPRRDGKSEMLLAGPDEPTWYGFDSLASLEIEIKPVQRTPTQGNDLSITSRPHG